MHHFGTYLNVRKTPADIRMHEKSNDQSHTHTARRVEQKTKEKQNKIEIKLWNSNSWIIVNANYYLLYFILQCNHRGPVFINSIREHRDTHMNWNVIAFPCHCFWLAYALPQFAKQHVMNNFTDYKLGDRVNRPCRMCVWCSMRFSKMIKVTSSMLISHFGWESTLFVHMPMVAMQSIIRAERHQTMHQCHFRPKLLHRSKVSRCVALASTIWELNKVRAVAVRSTSRIQCTCQHFNVARQIVDVMKI